MPKGGPCLLAACLLFFLAACTAHYPINTPAGSVQSLEKYSLKNLEGEKDEDRIILALSFSGGGTRAAAYAYGILEALSETRVVVNGNPGRLLEKIDIISSVSGGSFTAAYFGLFGDRIFSDFEEKFLKHDVESELKRRVMSPLNWPQLGSRYYERSDLAAEYYDELMFEGKTFKDILSSNGPIIIINATDISMGSQFSFASEKFAPICTDLTSYPVSRAVTASSAVPGLFSSIVLKNHAGTCDYQLPEWAVSAIDEKRINTRRYRFAKYLHDYQDTENYPYIHLFDGGISDNLGVRPYINSVTMSGGMWNKLGQFGLTHTSKFIVIVVNAQNREDTSYAKRDYSVPFFEAIGALSSVPLNYYSFETMELMRNKMAQWEKDISAMRCSDLNRRPSACAVDSYMIEVSFEAGDDEAERKHLESLPTTFHLEPADVDRLKAAAKKTLKASPVFQKLVSDLQ